MRLGADIVYQKKQKIQKSYQEMFQEPVVSATQFPLPDKNRHSTDLICTVIGAIFAIAMFVIACVLWRKDDFQHHFFTFDSLCKNGSFYSPHTFDLVDGECVSQCPQRPEKFHDYHGFCLPQDETYKHKYLQNPEIAALLEHDAFKQVLFFTFLVALGMGLLWMCLTHCIPRQVPKIAFVLAIITMLVLGILVLVLPDGYWSHEQGLKIFTAIICFVLVIIMMVMCCMYGDQLRFQGLFLQYSRQFLQTKPVHFLYIPIYLIFTVGLIALITWQHCCFAGRFGITRNFYNYNNVGVLEILNILEFIWGLRFLQDSFNFCVSGSAAHWYWSDTSDCYTAYHWLLCYHWGSVVFGSFVNGFFYLPTMLLEMLICHPDTCCSKMGTCCYSTCGCLLTLCNSVRSDAYAYTSMTGIPYCNAAMNCGRLCERSKHFVGQHSPIRHYRFVAHVFVVGVVLIPAWFILRSRVWNYGFWHFVLLVVVAYTTATWFLNIHADSAQGLQTSYLIEHQIQPRHEFMNRLLPSYSPELRNMHRSTLKDGTC